MGGPGSNRWGDYKKRGIVEFSLVLNIDALVNAGMDPTCESSGSIALACPPGGSGKTSFEYRLDPNFGEPLLTYWLVERELAGEIGLQKTRPHFGGVRWWFTCPSPLNQWCNRR